MKSSSLSEGSNSRKQTLLFTSTMISIFVITLNVITSICMCSMLIRSDVWGSQMLWYQPVIISSAGSFLLIGIISVIRYLIRGQIQHK